MKKCFSDVELCGYVLCVHLRQNNSNFGTNYTDATITYYITAITRLLNQLQTEDKSHVAKTTTESHGAPRRVSIT